MCSAQHTILISAYRVSSTCFPKTSYHHLHTQSCSSSSILKSNLLRSNLLLSSLSNSGKIDKARQVFDNLTTRDEFTWNTMISAYAISGRLQEATLLFNISPEKSTVTWSSLISGHCRHGRELQALSLFWQMQSHGLKPNQHSWATALRACSSLSDIYRGRQLHAHALKHITVESNSVVVTALLNMYSKCCCLADAEYLFSCTHSENRTQVMWTCMVTGYSQNGDISNAINTFRSMRVDGVEANDFSLPVLLSVCARTSSILLGVQLHACVARQGFDQNAFVSSALVDMYAKCGYLSCSRVLLEDSKFHDSVSWNSLIVAYGRSGWRDEALSLFQKMISRMRMDEFTYPTVLNILASPPSSLHTAESIHCCIIKNGYHGYLYVGNALVHVYSQLGRMKNGVEVFNEMETKDVISWTCLFTGYAHNGLHEEAVRLFVEMRVSGTELDQFCFASVLSACAELTTLVFGQQVHADFIKSKLSSSTSLENSLVSMYSKCGCLEEATSVFYRMRCRDVISWTSVIMGYAKNGRGRESIKMYEEMVSSGTRPDYVAFVGLLFACSHAGLVGSGRRYLKEMEQVYGIKPGIDHYSCMVDLYARSGKLMEAKKLLEEMEMEPDAAMWKTILSACRVEGEVEMAEMAATKLWELDPDGAVGYVMLSNVYSGEGRFMEAAKVRKKMREKGVWKVAGNSWMEVNGKVYSFMADGVVGEENYRGGEIYRKVEEMMGRIKDAGYVAELKFELHDVDAEGKEVGLTHHSERLAVALGLLHCPPAAPIRVFKNLRVCGDCHTFMKYVSKVFCRYIVLRDWNCFHHFRDGICSCSDYW